MKMSYRIVECQTRWLFLYLAESFAYGRTEWLAEALVGWGELSLGKPSVQWETFSTVPWLLHLGLGAVPALTAKPCRLIHSLAVPRAGSCRVWIRQGGQSEGQGCAQTSPMLRSSGGAVASRAFKELAICSVVWR